MTRVSLGSASAGNIKHVLVFGTTRDFHVMKKVAVADLVPPTG